MRTFSMGRTSESQSPRACAHGVFAFSGTEKKFAGPRPLCIYDGALQLAMQHCAEAMHHTVFARKLNTIFSDRLRRALI